MVSPTLGRGSLTALARPRSARCGGAVALAVVLAVWGSDWAAALTAATLVWASGLSARGRRVRVCGVVGVTVPTTQTPLARSKLPWVTVVEMTLSPAGIVSRMATFVAGSGPRLLRVTV